MKKIKKFLRFFIFLRKKSNKILCIISCVAILLSLLTVFCSANTVPGDDNVHKPYDVYFPYPNFSGFSFNYSVNAPLGMGTYEGRVYNTSNYIYGFNSSDFDPSDPNLDIQWQDGFYFTYPDNRIGGGLVGNTFNLTGRLKSYTPNPPSTLIEPGDVLLWSNLLWSSEVMDYITGDSLTVYYNDYVVSRYTSWFATPYAAVSRFIPEGNYNPGSFDYNLSYSVEYVAFNNFTGAAITSTYSYSDNSKLFPTSYEGGSAQYLYYNLTPYTFMKDFFANNPDVDYIFIKSSTCNLRVYDGFSSTEGSYFRNVNFYNYLINDEAYDKLNLNVSDYVNDAKGYKGGRHELLEADFAQWITNSIGSFMSVEIFPGFSFSLILSVLVGAFMFFFFLRLFAGG